ncbi:ComF family protein, partial [Patescibacteria group bacterium]|nr:ComF family protein [Patescibacteria group bacterium]
LASLIINHFQLLDNPPAFFEFLLISVPLEKRKLKQRGFNQAEELAKELSKSLKISLFNDVLIKIKETLPQVELSGKEREENIKDAFLCQNREKIQGKRILLVDDVYTTGSTMEEGARVLKIAGAKEVW